MAICDYDPRENPHHWIVGKDQLLKYEPIFTADHGTTDSGTSAVAISTWTSGGTYGSPLTPWVMPPATLQPQWPSHEDLTKMMREIQREQEEKFRKEDVARLEKALAETMAELEKVKEQPMPEPEKTPFDKAMEALAEAPKVEVRPGKRYVTVATRVEIFRRFFPGHSIITEIVQRDDDVVAVCCKILVSNGLIPVATGFSEERRTTFGVNKTSALENAETSAIGRALANFGLAGGEFASAEEVAQAIAGQQPTPKPRQPNWQEDEGDFLDAPPPRKPKTKDEDTEDFKLVNWEIVPYEKMPDDWYTIDKSAVMSYARVLCRAINMANHKDELTKLMENTLPIRTSLGKASIGTVFAQAFSEIYAAAMGRFNYLKRSQPTPQE